MTITTWLAKMIIHRKISKVFIVVAITAFEWAQHLFSDSQALGKPLSPFYIQM